MAGKNKTLYMKDEDRALWQQAANVPDKSISEVVAAGLRLYFAVHPPAKVQAETADTNETRTA